MYVWTRGSSSGMAHLLPVKKDMYLAVAECRVFFCHGKEADSEWFLLYTLYSFMEALVFLIFSNTSRRV